MRLEAVTVCVGYADFLAETLPLNKPHFDRLLVVTTPDDVDTQRICSYHHVECLITTAFTDLGGTFRKGAGINAGLQKLKDGRNAGAWVAHLDADIALPAQTRQTLENAKLDPTLVYGIDRLNVIGYDRWRQQCINPRIQQETDRCLVHLSDYPIGARLNVPKLGGWAPIGFFQLWNPFHSGVSSYPTDNDGADRTDMLFACQWPRAKRGFLPEIVAWHLESEPVPMGTNWAGRKTAPFVQRTQPTHYKVEEIARIFDVPLHLVSDKRRRRVNLDVVFALCALACLLPLFLASPVAALVGFVLWLVVWLFRHRPRKHRNPYLAE